MTRKERIIRLSFPGLLVLAGVVTILCLVTLLHGSEPAREAKRLLRKFKYVPPAEPQKAETPKTKPATSAPAASRPAKESTTKPRPKPKPKPKSKPKPKEPDPRETLLKDRNPFDDPQKKPFQARLVGVLGEWAFFENGSGLKVGEKYNGAKITKIGPDWVELDVDGKTKKISVFAGGPGSSGPSGPSPGSRRMMMRRGARPSGPPPGFKVTPEMIERFKQLPPEIRAKAMQNMPPEIREQLQKAM